MADGGLLLIYRGMTTEQLQEMQAKIQAQILNMGGFSSQTIGSKSYTRDLRFLQSQLEAMQFVLNERGAGGHGPYEGTVLTDFSMIETGGGKGQPAGSTDLLSY